jgi:hypothetical protein
MTVSGADGSGLFAHEVEPSRPATFGRGLAGQCNNCNNCNGIPLLLTFAKGVASLTRIRGRISAIKAALMGAAKMAFAIGILILLIAATTIIGATWLALTASGDVLR